MKIYCITFLLLASVLLTAGCAAQGTQAMYRGIPNVPHHRLVPLGVDPNIIFSMTDAQYNSYMNKLERYQAYTGRAIELDARAANAAKQWVNKSNQTQQYQSDMYRITSGATRKFSNELNRSIQDFIRSAFK
jgi:hypothetical protein